MTRRHQLIRLYGALVIAGVSMALITKRLNLSSWQSFWVCLCIGMFVGLICRTLDSQENKDHG